MCSDTKLLDPVAHTCVSLVLAADSTVLAAICFGFIEVSIVLL